MSAETHVPNDRQKYYDQGYKDAEIVCQNSQEASGRKDKTAASKPVAARPLIYNPAEKLAAILNNYRSKNYVGDFAPGDIRDILAQNWFEVQAYAHAIHDSEKETGNEQK